MKTSATLLFGVVVLLGAFASADAQNAESNAVVAPKPPQQVAAAAPASPDARGVLTPRLGHWGSINSVAFSPDSERILLGGYDSGLRLWDAGFGELIMTMRALPQGNWIAEFPDRHYRASDGARTWLAVIDGLQVLPLEPYEKVFRLTAPIAEPPAELSARPYAVCCVGSGTSAK